MHEIFDRNFRFTFLYLHLDIFIKRIVLLLTILGDLYVLESESEIFFEIFSYNEPGVGYVNENHMKQNKVFKINFTGFVAL